MTAILSSRPQLLPPQQVRWARLGARQASSMRQGGRERERGREREGERWRSRKRERKRERERARERLGWGRFFTDDHGEEGAELGRGLPQKALRGGIQSPVLEPFPRSWSPFVANCCQKLTNLIKIDFEILPRRGLCGSPDTQSLKPKDQSLKP